MSNQVLMVYVPPDPISKSSSKKIEQQRRLQKKGDHLQYFLVYKNEKNIYTLAIPNEEGVYDHYHKLENRDMIRGCKGLRSLDIYVFETAIIEEKGEEVYQFVPDGKLVCSYPIYKAVQKFGFTEFLTDAIKCYYEEKGSI